MSDALNLWFFRDLNDDQRLKLFGLFGLPIDEIGAHHGRQSVALKQVMQSLIKMVTKEVSPSPRTHLTALDRLEEIAKVQKGYYDLKQREFPCLEDFMDEEGVLNLPADIGPLLQQCSYNGRYSEADWWFSTIQKMKAEAPSPQTLTRGSANE